ncbi:MAG: hypothetical protein CSA55_05010 [Ilumatobacter coccineus]|uniref:Uncharacterized protein n=1 Tax=Ilumatobacter coccineus TaxID=467094 RepID=A0A2G6KAD2_9ACTN|nr:MAG: hypothetical protein CSA55_05010 [Ilumatobacter coccineus]
MSRRIDIELTSALEDGSWTWRAAGARQPRGVLDGSILPSEAKVGDQIKVEVDQELDGITVLSVVQGRAKAERTDLLELLPVEKEFTPVVETRAPGGRKGRDGRGRGRGRRDGERRGRGRGRDGEGGRGRGRRGDRDRGPRFAPPPELPMRPRPKRLKPGKAHRNEVLAGLPDEQRPIAELALQGMNAVRKRVRAENEAAKKDGKPEMPEATVLKMAEDLLPKLRVAEWLDRAEAAQRQMETLDLRDLRSVVAAAGDPVVARDESTTALAEEMKQALLVKQEQELQLWFGDVDAALAVGRVVRALRLSSQPPKAGVPFPGDISQRLIDSTNAALAPMDSPERWSTMLEAAAFSPIRLAVQPTRIPDVVNDDLLATVKRLAPLLPQVAAMFDVEVDPDAPMPKPLRQGPRGRQRGNERRGGRDDRRSQRRRDQSGGDKAAPKIDAKPSDPPAKADDQPSDAPATTDDQS